MDTKELYWAAGFLEGEGYFCNSNSPTITAAQVNPEPLLRLRDVLGGKIEGPYSTNNPRHQPALRWRVSGTVAVSLMMTLYSLLSEKRQKSIRSALQAWKLAPGNARTWHKLGRCKNGHALEGANYIVAPSGHGRCRQCGIEGRRRYYLKNKDKWRDYAARRRNGADVLH